MSRVLQHHYQFHRCDGVRSVKAFLETGHQRWISAGVLLCLVNAGECLSLSSLVCCELRGAKLDANDMGAGSLQHYNFNLALLVKVIEEDYNGKADRYFFGNMTEQFQSGIPFGCPGYLDILNDLEAAYELSLNATNVTMLG